MQLDGMALLPHTFDNPEASTIYCATARGGATERYAAIFSEMRVIYA